MTESYEDLKDFNKMFFAKNGRSVRSVYKEFDSAAQKVLSALQTIPGLSQDDIHTAYYKNGKLKQSPRLTE